MPESNSSNEELLKARVEEHLQISGLVRNVLSRFNVVSIADLCELDVEVVAREKGIGVKKLDSLRGLIADARQLASFSREEQSIDRPQSVRGQVEFESALLFVPSLIREGLGATPGTGRRDSAGYGISSGNVRKRTGSRR